MNLLNWHNLRNHFDPVNPCNDFSQDSGETGGCNGDGHFMCLHCTKLSKEGLKDHLDVCLGKDPNANSLFLEG